MSEDFVASPEKPSNTEVLGLLLDPNKKDFISNLNRQNIKALCQQLYLIRRLNNKEKNAVEIHEEVLGRYLIYLCSEKGLRAGQIVDALKHIIEQEDKQMQSLVDSVKK